MKFARHMAGGIIVLVMATGCNDFLEVTPPSSLSPELYFKTDAQLAAYTIQYYADYGQYQEDSSTTGGMLPSHFGNGFDSFYLDDRATDNLVQKGSNNRFLINGMDGEWKIGNGGHWNFNNIYKWNYFINVAETNYANGEISGNDDIIKHYIGEGYFLRAHEYFFRLRKLGDFPIITETLPDDKEILMQNSERKPRNEVARFILSDLDKAIDMMQETAPAGGKTRLNKKAARLLKARVALFEATWLKYHAGTAMVPKGPNWPGESKEYSRGYTYPLGSIDAEISYFLDQAIAASAAVADATPLVSNSKQVVGPATETTPVNDYYDMFWSDNPEGYSEVIMFRRAILGLSGEHWLNHYNNGGGGYGFTKHFEKTFLMENGLPIYAAGSGYEGDNRISDTKINRDWRWRLFMKAPNELRKTYDTENPFAKIYFPAFPTVWSNDNRQATSTGYIHGKGYSLDAARGATMGHDWTASVIFRAAEAYLIYMEASYLKNGSIDSKADAYWRALRARAGVDPDYNKTIAATVMTEEAKNDWAAYSAGQLIDPTLYNIRRERRTEFIGENFRYPDLIRWRAMDQLNGFQIEGSKIWSDEMQADNNAMPNSSALTHLPASGPNVSAPSLSDYMRTNQVTQGQYYQGLFFTQAHYLTPIGIDNIRIASPDDATLELSPIYQNPGWSYTVGEGETD